MAIIVRTLLALFLFHFYADVSYAIEQTTEYVLEKFRAMSEVSGTDQREISALEKSNLTRDDVEKFLSKVRENKHHVSISESLGKNLAGLDLSGLDFSNIMMYEVNLEGAGSWQHNKGMRIDHILISPAVADKIAKAGILTEPRGWDKPSDHAPVYIA